MAGFAARGRRFDWAQPAVMGILNVTPDSFSDGGRHSTLDAAIARARQMAAEGATIIDVGGESTRPGAEPVSEAEELRRVIPVIERLAVEFDGLISVDTMKPAVMDAACRAGAGMINDVMALRVPGAIEVAARQRVAVCLMHMRGEPRTMQQATDYGDVVAEVRGFLAERVAACHAAGVGLECLVLDPGFGFGKRIEHNLELLARLPELATLGRPLLVGVSRKSMFRDLLGAPVERRLAGGLAATAVAVWLGCAIVRTHDVAETVGAVRTAHALRAAARSAPSHIDS